MPNTETEYISQTLHKANALKSVLSNEFESLKDQNLELFENLQSQKLEILDFLASEELLDRIKSYTDSKDAMVDNVAMWQQVMDLMKE